MDLEKTKLTLTRYRMNEFKLFIPPTYKTPYEVESSNVSDILIEKNYDSDYIFPYFEVSVNLPSKVIRTLKKYSNNVTAKIDFQYGNFKDNEINEKELPVFKSYIKDTFYVFISDTSPDINQTASEKVESDADTGADGQALGDNETISLLLYNKDYLFNLKKVVNSILVSVSAVEAITFLLNQSDIKNILISPPDSYKKYSQLPLVPITVSEQIKRIISKYGIHKSGTLIFFDVDRGYILDKSKKCTAYESSENKKTYLINTSGDNDDAKGCYNDTSKKHNIINVMSNCISFKDNSELANQIYGNTLTTVDSNGNVSSIDTGGNKSKYTPLASTKIVVQDGEDDVSESVATDIKDAGNVMTLQFNYVDLNMLTPNLQFITYFTDSNLKKYNSKYRITKMICQFSKEGDFFIPNISAEFR